MYRPSAKVRLVINFSLFQLCWFSALFMQADAIFFILVCIAAMFIFVSNKKQSGFLVICLLPVSLLLEILSISLGIINYGSPTIPVWLVGIWVAFILTFNESLKKVMSLGVWQAMCLFAVFAPLSYQAGEKFGALTIDFSLVDFWFAFSAIWAVYSVAVRTLYRAITTNF
ncbi:DUF2878 domain-containing protein [Pseudoalteromonas aurantia]|uniref:DUF2878 domain-containing protein n=1 Tax=Pseudoalteromonas aurantia 208 TaxID=1314867 RepID=A0ABR9EGF1_9GAMM|nr:DUF2878 domain-containing protein [Pseudoalteromonas aurantia]MBE0370064.1 hypothetical protein [Pseudoalteromonas aurantia 208]